MRLCRRCLTIVVTLSFSVHAVFVQHALCRNSRWEACLLIAKQVCVIGACCEGASVLIGFRIGVEMQCFFKHLKIYLI